MHRATLPPEALGENPVLVSSGFWGLLEFLDLWPHLFNLRLCVHTASSSVRVGDLPLVRTPVMAFRGPPNNPGYLSRLKSVNFITSADSLSSKGTMTGFWDEGLIPSGGHYSAVRHLQYLTFFSSLVSFSREEPSDLLLLSAMLLALRGGRGVHL